MTTSDRVVLSEFSAHGRSYQVLLSRYSDRVEVRAFLDGSFANGFSYSVSLEKAHDLAVVAGLDAVAELAAIAERDVAEERYESLLQALSLDQLK